jgi:RNA polymerase sigma-70 factor (ECF subfamily)
MLTLVSIKRIKMDKKIIEIYSRFSDSLKKYIQKSVKDRDVADDIFQDVLLKIHSNVSTLNDDQRLAGWIFQVARNAIADHFRADKEIAEYEDSIAAADSSGNADDPARKILPYIRFLVEILPEPYRRALILTEFEGLSQKELAEKEGISISGAKSRVQRGRAMVREMLLVCCHFELDARKHIIDYQPNCNCCASGCTPQK